MRATFRAAVWVSIGVMIGAAVGPAGGASADPIRSASVNMWGNDVGYTASMVGNVDSWTSFTGAVLPIGSTTIRWGVTSGATSVGGSCVIGLATHIDMDPSSGRVSFDCFALGHATQEGTGPGGNLVVYQAYLFGNVHMTLTAGAGASVEAMSSPLAIGFPNRPGGWWPVWGVQNVACLGENPCTLDVAP